MKDILDVIVYIGFIITIASTLIIGFKSGGKKVKKSREELIKEGKSVSSEKNPKHVLKVLGGMFGSAILITAILICILKVKFSLSPFLWLVFFVFMLESVIGSMWAFAKHVREIHKEEGTMGTIIILVIFIILEASYLYIKDFK